MVRSLLVLLVWCCHLAAAYRPNEQVCSYETSNSRCAINDLTPSTTDKSILIYPGGETRCAFDDFQSETYQTNKTYFFQVFPSTKAKKLLLYFQGGGACIDPVSCNFQVQCVLPKPTFFTNAKASSAGVLDRNNPQNPFASDEWTIVNIPYCTGDLHAGNNQVIPDQRSAEAVAKMVATFGSDKPACQQETNRTMHLNGHANARSALQWALKNVPEPQQIVIGGASAGALAAQTYQRLVHEYWNQAPDVMADSYAGVFPEQKQPVGAILDFYGFCQLGLLPLTPNECKQSSVKQLIGSVLTNSTQRWLFLNSKEDLIQRTFYTMMQDGMQAYPFLGTIVDGSTFYENATALLSAYKRMHNALASSFVDGSAHVFLSTDRFYTATTDSGVAVVQLIKDWLVSTPSNDSTSTPTQSDTPNQTGSSNQSNQPNQSSISSPNPTSSSIHPDARADAHVAC